MQWIFDPYENYTCRFFSLDDNFKINIAIDWDALVHIQTEKRLKGVRAGLAKIIIEFPATN
jgi:hypothetical protein